MEILRSNLSNPLYHRNTLRFFLDQSHSNLSKKTADIMLTMAARIKKERKTLHGALCPQKLRIARFINNEYVHIFEIHQSSRKSTFIGIDDVRILSHSIPYKYVLTDNVHKIEKHEMVLKTQLDKMLTERQRQLFTANFELDESNRGEIQAPYYYIQDVNRRQEKQLTYRQSKESEIDVDTEGGDTNAYSATVLETRSTLGNVGRAQTSVRPFQSDATNTLDVFDVDPIYNYVDDNPIFEYFWLNDNNN